MVDPTPAEIRAFIAGCNLARHGWDRFQQGNRRSAARTLAKMALEDVMPRYEVRTLPADPTVRADEFWQEGGPDPLYYIYDTHRESTVYGYTSHGRAFIEQQCAELNKTADRKAQP